MTAQQKAWFPFLFLLLVIPWADAIDLGVARWAYSSEGAFWNGPLLQFMYNYATFPARLIGACGLLVFLFSFLKPQLAPCRRACLVLFLMLSLGAGVIANVVFKNNWGRPRPKQVIEFGGTEAFRSFYTPRMDRCEVLCRSFPCGHCTMGFYFFTFIYLGRRHRIRLLSLSGYLVGLSLGVALGITRVLQGGHFVTDVIAGGCMMWTLAYYLDDWVYVKLAIRYPTLFPGGNYERAHGTAARGSHIH